MTLRRGLAFLTFLAAASVAPAQWVEFNERTAQRLLADPAVGANDAAEKDYAYGDVDGDGDIDLVVVRKSIGTSAGKRTNVLLINENGVLVDRTLQFCSDSDVLGDQGFLTPTNDRDVQLIDVTGDALLDIVTATTISDGDPKEIGHPRVYRNLGSDAGGAWLGFRYEQSRIPQMLAVNGLPANPRFCGVAAGDVTGDGVADLYFSDYDTSAFGPAEAPGADFDDRLLVNNGSGFFTDETSGRFSGIFPTVGLPFPVSNFGASAEIADMNGDGSNDIVKQTALFSPLYVGIAYNQPDLEGFFDTYQLVNQGAPYFLSVGDLNNDNRLDIVISDDGADRYFLNQGNAESGTALFTSFVFSFDAAGDSGFGSNSRIEDLNNDGWNDIVIVGSDVDSPNCGFRTHIYRNLGGAPGDNVVLQEQTTGTGCNLSAGHPPTCLVAGIPADELLGLHDVAIFDIDNDGLKDMVLGKCNETQVWMNGAPAGLNFTYPEGLPLFPAPNQSQSFKLQITGFGGPVLIEGATKFWLAVNGGPFEQQPITNLGGGLYQVALPAAACTDNIDFAFTARDTSGDEHSDPLTGPSAPYRAIASLGSIIALEEGFEGLVDNWTVVNDPSMTGGGWEVAVPEGSVAPDGEPAAPGGDAEAALDRVRAFVTENGTINGLASSGDVDGGPTDLVSPVFDLSGTDAFIHYSRWYYSSGNDQLVVSVTNNGTNWIEVERVPGDANDWRASSFRVSDFVAPTSTVQVRFRADDTPNDSVVEAALDAFRVEKFLCQPCDLASECDDGIHCNGAETCSAGACTPGSAPCPGTFCEEASQLCLQCLIDEHCDDGAFCSGAESCTANACTPAADPCPGQLCNETLDICADCLDDALCDDGLFCNGIESCSVGACVVGAESCPGRLCDEIADVCVGTVPLQPRMGRPLLGLDDEELDRFDAGKSAFNTLFTESTGLGPVFNQVSCGTCHNNPLGGPGSLTVTRFGAADAKLGTFDPLTRLGGSLMQAQAIHTQCLETIPPEANVSASRLTNSTLGLGLIEAITDADLEDLELNPPTGISGRVHWVAPLEEPTATRAGRFGWKSQVATVLSFSADAARNEMGITNRLLPTENAPNGDATLLAQCDTQPDPEDGPDAEGFDFIDRVTDFQRFLAPPPQTPRNGLNGEIWFNIAGCAACHKAVFTTPDSPLLEAALRDRTLKPYSDFLLHDMGQSADFIEQDDAAQREMRTPALWGLRARDPLWHDGRIAGGTFESRVLAAIALHDAVDSEAQSSAQALAGLPPAVSTSLVAFLDSLGRAEFDHDGDNDVDRDDYFAFLACFSGPGLVYGPDDSCSISDVDQDGDVDDDDRGGFISAAEGFAGAVPDGTLVPGTPLRIEKAPGDQIALTWGASCNTDDLDYAIYEGMLGDFATHAAVECGVVATTTTLSPPTGSAYYLVVPGNGFREGSLGVDSAGQPRPEGGATCLPRSFVPCF